MGDDHYHIVSVQWGFLRWSAGPRKADDSRVGDRWWYGAPARVLAVARARRAIRREIRRLDRVQRERQRYDRPLRVG